MAHSSSERIDFIAPAGSPRHGIRFGSDRAVLTPRRRDRREGLADLLQALTRALDRQADVSLMRGAFERAMLRLVPVRSIQLREAGSRWAGRVDQGTGCESVAFEVPSSESATKGVLEATFDPACRLGEWDFQMLALAAHLGALVLEIERGRLQSVRTAIGPPVQAAAGAASLDGTRPRRESSRVAPLVGGTPPMEALRAAIDRVAATDFTILLEGESGVGKELVAQQIHARSRRREGPFVAVNCAALVETLLEAELFGIEERTATGVRGRRGKFEHADGGTLFLDEVSDLSPSAQAKLLRAIQDLTVERVGATGSRRVDIRVVAATNRSLAGLVERGLFRADLYYRLSGVDVRVPTLRERRADIPVLAEFFLRRHRPFRPVRLSTCALDALVTYDWPGNVRELERTVERAVAFVDSDAIEVEDLPANVRGGYAAAIGPSLKRNDTLRAWAGRYARLVLERCKNNKREACRVLGISYHTLQAYVRQPSSGEPESLEAMSPRQVGGVATVSESLVEADM